MKSTRSLSVSCVVACAVAIAAFEAGAHGIVRRQASSFPIATSVVVPAGAELVFVSGTLPSAADPQASPGSRERIGDTAAQARSVLGKIAAELEAAGFSMRDVVKMNVYLVGEPDEGGAMDLAGLMSAYMESFGKDAGGLPARTRVQISGLAVPGALVEIEVVAARGADHAHD